MVSKDKRVSVYLKTGRKAGTSYYRFYQYFDRMAGTFKYRKMLPDDIFDKLMPISRKSFFSKTLIYIYILIRRSSQLTSDLFWNPQYVIISRCLINKHIPLWIKFLLWIIRTRGTTVIWDFDDDIIAGGEIGRKVFDWQASVSSIIIIGSPYLKSLLEEHSHSRTIYLPTTDGEMAAPSFPLIEENRLQLFHDEVRLIWVGTFSGLGFLEQIWDDLEECAIYLDNRQLVLTIVSDNTVEYQPKNFVLKQIPWQRDRAIREMEVSHIGIMPLEDTIATRGKCGFKLIQYLAAALPVIGSSVGINKLIISENVGFSINPYEKGMWCKAILAMTKSEAIWQEYSRAALDRWRMNYNSESNLDIWKQIIN